MSTQPIDLALAPSSRIADESFLSPGDGMPCPLCGATAEHRRDVASSALIAHWRAHIGFDIARELSHVQHVSEYGCGCCGLVHYLPHAPGSEGLYRQLQALPWYYGHDKWEHRLALHDIAKDAVVLEVGCGEGAFLDVVRDRRRARATGIDLNAAAVAAARRQGRSAVVADVQSMAARHAGEYDAVCAFQVLEHITDPRSFLEACVSLLRPGGRLCLGVPNNDGYLGSQRLEDASLNLPPHHATRWGARTLRTVETLFPLKLRRLRCEPLTRHHAPEFVSVCMDAHGVSGRRLRRSVAVVGSVALTGFGLRRFVRGHTIYASYDRTPSASTAAGPPVTQPLPSTDGPDRGPERNGQTIPAVDDHDRDGQRHEIRFVELLA
jgi:2-polyprenyl-3-methyl-5-hydroxy-6-metoxy-1,4-benzoquinol methylase